MWFATLGLVVLMLATVSVARTVQAPQPRRIAIEAERFNFTPSRIKLTAGDEIDIVLRSADTAHGFKVEGTDIAIEIPKRGRGDVVVHFKASQVGRFTFECHRMCGAGHAFMRGEIVVEEKE